MSKKPPNTSVPAKGQSEDIIHLVIFGITVSGGRSASKSPIWTSSHQPSAAKLTNPRKTGKVHLRLPSPNLNHDFSDYLPRDLYISCRALLQMIPEED